MKTLRIVLALVALHVCSGYSQGVKPLEGDAFAEAIEAQQAGLQDTIRSIIPATLGCFVSGPLDVSLPDSVFGYHQIRVVCPDIQAQERALEKLEQSEILPVDSVQRGYDSSFAAYPPGVRGAKVFLPANRPVMCLTWSQLRYLIWYRDNLYPCVSDLDTANANRYARAVSAYLYEASFNETDVTSPDAESFELPIETDLFAPMPDYVIEGYQNYKDFLRSHATIHTDFAEGILGFIPNDSLEFMLKALAPGAAFPNKEYPKLQKELSEFFERGGDPRVMETLTKAVFDTLRAGEYFFGVGLNGTIRFGRELLREEVKRIERETGKKAPRANHAFLFPGEPLLTAGAFFVTIEDSVRNLSEINAQSGHYFYSNIQPTIREDIAERSDYYLATLGHLLSALDSLGIPHDKILIRKF